MQVSTAPADSPKASTRAGSPPKLATLRETHSSAATRSRRPKFAATPDGLSGRQRRDRHEAERPEPVLHGDDDRPRPGREVGAVVEELAVA